MTKLLIKKQFIEIFRSYFYDAKKNTARSKAGTILYFVLFAFLIVVVFGGTFGSMAFAMCGPLSQAGYGWLYFLVMSMSALFIGIIGSVFNSYSTLYLAKDNDLLLSLPIPISKIIFSRLISVYLLGLMYSGFIILPTVIVYQIVRSFDPAALAGGIMLLILMSLAVFILSCVLGWVVAKISLKIKSKSFAIVAASLIFIGLYYFVAFRANLLINDLIINAAKYGDKIRGSAGLLFLFGKIGEGNLKAILIFTAVFAALTALVWIVIKRSFLGIATSTGAVAKTEYKEKAVKVNSLSAALLSKELKKLTSDANYMLNCGLGTLLIPAVGVLALIKGKMIVGQINSGFGVDGLAEIAVFSLLCLASTMNDLAAPSISLEGKNIWVLQSLPVSAWQVLKAKIDLQLLLTGVPMLIACILSVTALECPIAVKALLTVAALMFSVFMALFGMFFGLKMPNLNWTNETTVLKQSAPVMFGLFGGWFFVLVLGAGFLLTHRFFGIGVYFTIVIALLLAASVLLTLWIKKKGTQIFESL